MGGVDPFGWGRDGGGATTATIPSGDEIRVPEVMAVNVVERFREEQRKADRRTAERRAKQAEAFRRGPHRYAGVTVKDGTIRYKRISGPLAGAVARVETAGQIRERVTATRILATGIFAWAFKKQKDDRQLYLVVEGSGFGFVVELDAKDQKERGNAERFASIVNGLAGGLASSVLPLEQAAPSDDRPLGG